MLAGNAVVVFFFDDDEEEEEEEEEEEDDEEDGASFEMATQSMSVGHMPNVGPDTPAP